MASLIAMEGRTWVIQRLLQEIEKRQITDEDLPEIDLEKRDFFIVV